MSFIHILFTAADYSDVTERTDVKFHLRFTFNSKETISPEPSFTAVSVSLQAVEATSV